MKISAYLFRLSQSQNIASEGLNNLALLCTICCCMKFFTNSCCFPQRHYIRIERKRHFVQHIESDVSRRQCVCYVKFGSLTALPLSPLFPPLFSLLGRLAASCSLNEGGEAAEQCRLLMQAKLPHRPQCRQGQAVFARGLNAGEERLHYCFVCLLQKYAILEVLQRKDEPTLL